MLSNIIAAVVNNFGEVFVPSLATPSVQFLFGAKNLTQQTGANQVVVIPDKDTAQGPEVSFVQPSAKVSFVQPSANARELRRAWARVSFLIWGPNSQLGPWSASTAQAAGSLAVPSPSGQTTFYYSASGGTTGATEPAWPSSVGGTVLDGSCTWTCVGAVQDYEIHATDPTELIRNALVVAIHYACAGAYRLIDAHWYSRSDLLVMYGQAYRLVVDFNTPWVDVLPTTATITRIPLTASVSVS